jgi:hypothetical protein
MCYFLSGIEAGEHLFGEKTEVLYYVLYIKHKLQTNETIKV